MGETFDKELVKKQYPFPIATYYAKMQKEEMLISKKKSSYQKLFLSMIDAFEITLRFLGVVVIKEYLDTEKPNEDFNKLLIEKLFKKMSLGDWLSIFRDGSKRDMNTGKKYMIMEILICLKDHPMIGFY